MNILFVTSEAAPFAKSGGLGDVAGSLPKALSNKGIDARVILPLYADIDEKYKKLMTKIADYDVSLSWRRQKCEVFKLEYEGVIYYFIGNSYYFGRENLYGYYDDAERFLYFSKTVLDILPNLDFMPDILHCNDWQTALIPFLLNKHYKEYYNKLKTILTIHNIKYQGIYGSQTLYDILDLTPEEITDDLEYKGDINIMKAGIYNADWITTVSPSYAKELEHEYYGEGLQGVIRDNSYKITGILNGIDYNVHNPQIDKNIYFNYKYSLKKKSENKIQLIQNLGIEYDENKPLVAIISRLVELKGIDLITFVIYEIMKLGINLVVLGTGDKKYEEVFKHINNSFPHNSSINIKFDNSLASKIYAGSDILLMPSRVEPCGLAQMIALKYGTIPLVRKTGGLNDSIIKFDEATGEGNGFTFNAYNAHEMLNELTRAVYLYKHDKNSWEKLLSNAFKSKFDWNLSANKYIEIYNKIL